MSDNRIDDDCAFALAESLRANRTLTSLIFSSRSEYDPFFSDNGYQIISYAGAGALGLAIRVSTRGAPFKLAGVSLGQAWKELGLAQEAGEWSNEDIIGTWLEEKNRRVALLLTCGMGMIPRLGEASAFHGLDKDLFELVGSATLSWGRRG